MRSSKRAIDFAMRTKAIASYWARRTSVVTMILSKYPMNLPARATPGSSVWGIFRCRQSRPTSQPPPQMLTAYEMTVTGITYQRFMLGFLTFQG
ncbi:hypothetical protein AMJ39_09840 [candidate division TA06 bacterium DG_24]|uniref:Uncharacterized protein n=1 Tax=candidate division TA06 bacterium DG_24 TaxID=1703770 RepID=A0A0S7WMM2_UNCT6|nr:MAG: hypothetical protein AMJ39_09840 [candidate division TA06 bacterium DG_24]